MSMAAAGGSFSSRPIAFSDDAKLLITLNNKNINLMSAVTGEVVGILEGHAADVSCAVINPRDSSQLYTASRDGTIKLWDYRNQSCIKTLQVRETVCNMVVHRELHVAYLAIEWRDGSSGRVLTYNLDSGRAGATAMKVRAPGTLALSPSGSFVATVDKHSLFVWRSGHEMLQPLNLHHTKTYTCIAFNSDDTVLAAGDATGRILIWRDFGAHVPGERREGHFIGKHRPSAPPPVTTLHWHSSAVGCLAFSPDGTYLLSGGAEGVLVIWQLADNSRTYLPRLGGGLIGIHPSPADPAKYCIRQSDNTLRIINTATMKVETSVLGVRPCPHGLAAEAAAAATVLQPGSGHLLLPCNNAQLQLYDVQHHRHVAVLQVSPRNAITSSERPDDWGPYGPPAEPLVVQAAFSQDGSVLATVDVRPDAGPFGSTEATLKFWDMASSAVQQGAGPSFVLNTRVDDPHRGPVTSLTYHPSMHMAVTTGAGEFRVWVRAAAQRRPGGKQASPLYWRCRSMGSYKGLPLTASAFTSDGSVLAVAAGPKVTLWDPMSNQLAAALPSLPTESQSSSILRLAFVPGTPYLVAASRHCLAVYNLLTASLHWSLGITTCALAADPQLGRFAVAAPIHTSTSTRNPSPACGGIKAPSTPGMEQEALEASDAQQEMSAASPAAAEEANEAADEAAAAIDRRAAEGASATAAASSRATASEGAAAAASRWHSSQGTSSCHVLIFDPSSPAAKYHVPVPNTSSVVLLYATSDMPQHSTATAGLPADVGALLMLTSNRSYSFALAADASKRAATATSSNQALLTQPDEVSAFEAAFGKLQPASTATADARQTADNMDVDASAADAQWQQLFDAPSHMLPPPTALARAFLTLLTAASQTSV